MQLPPGTKRAPDREGPPSEDELEAEEAAEGLILPRSGDAPPPAADDEEEPLTDLDAMRFGLRTASGR